MKYIITERQYSLLLEDDNAILLQNENPIFDDVVVLNKKFLGLPQNPQITPEYTKKINEYLSKKGVDESKRTLMGSLVNLIPIWETVIDIETVVDGITTGNKAKLKGGLIGLTNPIFSWKALQSLMGWFIEKSLGKKTADYFENAPEEIVNMDHSQQERLFKKYGLGWYEKWVKAGRPKI